MKYELESMFSIRGRIAVIIGAAGGMGREISLAFAELGVKLALVDLNENPLRELQSKLKGISQDVITLSVNITDKGSVEKMADAVVSKFGRIDILINCAGRSHLEEAVHFDENKWDEILNVNLKGTFLTCQAVGKQMLKQKEGRIVNFSSVRGVQGRSQDMAYSPSKGAINQLTRSLAIEWAKAGVNVNAIAPTFVLTDMNRGILEDEQNHDWVLRRIPKGKLGKPEDIIGPLVFLCSSCSAFVTGHILFVDGGWTAA